MSKKDKQKDQSKNQPEETEGQVAEQNDLEQQINQLSEDLKRAQADFINLKRRTEQERSARALTIKTEIIRDVLPVLDSLEQAVAHKPDDLADNDWAKGIDVIYKQLQKILSQYGVSKIESVGAEFDPNLHEAVSMDESNEGNTEVVVEEMQPGYKLDDNVVRHAMVVVGKKPDK